jgi:hypothetical protein
MSRVQKVMTQPVNVIFSMLRSVRARREWSTVLGSRSSAPPTPRLLRHARSLLAAQKQRVSIWLFEQPSLRLEGRIAVRAGRHRGGPTGAACCAGDSMDGRSVARDDLRVLAVRPPTQGFDEYMNIVLDDAEEVREGRAVKMDKPGITGRSVWEQTPGSFVHMLITPVATVCIACLLSAAAG